MLAALRQITGWKDLLRLVYPPLCPGCEEAFDEEAGAPLCPVCVQGLSEIRGDLCERCGHPLSERNLVQDGLCRYCPVKPIHFDSARSALAYEGPARGLIHRLKFSFHTRYAPYLGEWLARTYDVQFRGRVDILIPVPLHWFRRRWREFNQADLLARNLAARTGTRWDPGILQRTRYTDPQSGTRTGNKRRNVHGAFRVRHPERVQGKEVLLVDDVYTSGNTVNECAAVLKNGGARRVHVLTVCRALRG